MISVTARAESTIVAVQIGNDCARMTVEDAKSLVERLEHVLPNAIEKACVNKRGVLLARRTTLLKDLEDLDKQILELFPEGFPEITGAANAMNTN